MFTILPLRCRFITGATAWQKRNVPSRLKAMSRCHSASVNSSTAAPGCEMIVLPPPAFTRMSTRPLISQHGAAVDELTLAEWQRLIAFNLDGTFLFCHTVAPVMKRQRGGKIVNISSVAGRGLSASSSSAYAAAKGGIIAFTRKLAHELGPFGVNVNAIAPSLTLTERIRPRWEQRR